MPAYRKRKYSGSFGFRKRRRFSRRSRRRLRSRKRSRLVHRFVTRTTTHENAGGTITSIAQSNVAVTSGGLFARLTHLPNSSELGVLYDQFCIDKVVVRFIPRGSRNSIEEQNTGAAAVQVALYTALDQDAGTAPASVALINEYTTCKRSNGFRMHKRVCYPRALAPLYRPVTNAYGLSKKIWCDMAYSDVPLYTYVYVIPGSGGAANQVQTWDLESTFYYRCRSVR